MGISAECFQKLQEITSRMFIPSTDATSVNDLQYQLFFVFNEERWIPVNFHLVKTACVCMSLMLTRLQFGGAACKRGHLCQVQKELMDHL